MEIDFLKETTLSEPLKQSSLLLFNLNCTKKMNEKVKDLLNIRYIKLHFEIRFLYDSHLCAYKPLDLRGGMGYMLMDKYCIADKECGSCAFSQECVMKRVLYAQPEIRPFFVKEGKRDEGSCGLVIECEDDRTGFSAGNELHFNILLFGKTIAYFRQILDAFTDLGKKGFGPDKAYFEVTRVTNTLGQDLYRDGIVFREHFNICMVRDYVDYRLKKKMGLRAVFHAPAELWVRKKLITEFDPVVIFSSIARRIYVLNLFEGNDIDMMPIGRDGKDDFIDVPEMSGQHAWVEKNWRYSTRTKMEYPMLGIKGYIDFAALTEDQYALLLAGELIHIGKDTRFGYGRYTMVDNRRP